MAHVQEIAKHPHPVGTVANEAVREYLLAKLRDLQLDPSVQSGFAAASPPFQGAVGEVHNIVATLPGREHGKALLLSAHYDSVATGPGAADNGASVAAVLETVRALKARGPLRNDVIVLFTDAEEVGLLGAELFVAEHPRAKDVALVLNFDYRGNRGAIALFEMTEGNGALVSGLADTSPKIVANSLLYEIYKVLPSDTDMTVFRRAGFAGMNFAAGEGYTSYHSALDTPELLSKATLQQQGEVMVALSQRFGNSSLDQLKGSDAIYFEFPVVGLVHYPFPIALAIAAAALALLLVAWQLGRRRGLRSSRIVLGAMVFVAMVVLLAVAAEGFWRVILALHPQYSAMLQGDTYNSNWYGLAAVALSIAIFLALQALVARWIDPSELGLGAALCWLIALILACIMMPGVSFLLSWPLIFVLLTSAVVLSRRGSEWSVAARIGVLLGGLAPAVLLGAPLLKTLFVALTPTLLWVMVAVLALFLGLASPVLGALRPRQLVIIALLLCGIGFIGKAERLAAFAPDRPRPDELTYLLDSGTGNAFWVSGDDKLDSWNAQFFKGVAAPRLAPDLFGGNTYPFWVNRAPAVALKAPRVDVLEDKTINGTRTLTLNIASLRAAPRLKVIVEGGTVVSSRVQGRPPTKEQRKRWSLNAYGMADQELHIELEVIRADNLEVRVTDFSLGFPDQLVEPRPAGFIVQPFSAGDTTQVMTVRKLVAK